MKTKVVAFILVSLFVFAACAAPASTARPTQTALLPSSEALLSSETPAPLPSTGIPTPSLNPTLNHTSPPFLRWNLAASDIKSLAAEEIKIAMQEDEAWQSHDLDVIRNQYTQDIVHYDGYPRFVGIDEVMYMAEHMLIAYPQFAGRLGETYIGRQDWVSAYQLWNFEGYTQEHPVLEYDLFRTRDGRISYWRLFYGIDYLDNVEGITVNTKLLTDYAAVWSSGNPQEVAAFYSQVAERQDMLFMDYAQGRDDIQSYAASFFSWYPGVRLELLQQFGEGLSNERGSDMKIMQGGIYAIRISKTDGSSCEVRMLVLLETSNAGVVSERVYYTADSLIACGWVE
jgi:hypothetical protein